jgi:hypothetical protein
MRDESICAAVRASNSMGPLQKSGLFNRCRQLICGVLLLAICGLLPQPALAQWGGWEDLGGIIFEAPNCVNWGANRIDCFARGTDRAMYHRWWDGNQWGGWEDLGGVILESPNCISWSVNRIDCFARGLNLPCGSV